MTPERADELRRRYPSLKFVGEMADEIDRLRDAYERLAACVRELDDRAQALIEKDYES